MTRRKKLPKADRSGRKTSLSRPFRLPQRTKKDGATGGAEWRKPAPQGARSVLVQIEKPVYGGAFLARVEGKAMFVPLALPGEQTQVRVVEEKGDYATAEVDEIVVASPQRIAARCSHFGACGSCQYQHADYAGQVDFKLQMMRETLQRAGVQPPRQIAVMAGEPWAYRNRIRVAFDAEGRAGYRGRRSHTVVPIAECPIAAPLLVRAALAASEMVREMPLRRRPEEISLFCDAEEKELLASVTVRSSAKDWFEGFAQRVAARIPETQGVELLAAGSREQLARSVARWGADSLLYRAAGFAYRVDHGAFFQVNRWLVDSLVDAVVARGASGSSDKLAWDLFAGVGLFARRLAGGFDRVIAVEASATAAKALAQNLAGARASAVKAATLDFLRRAASAERPDLIVVDPPRTGLGAETTAMLAQIGAPTLVYVSCDPATLARDVRALVGAGYALESLALADLFPQTFHIETITRLQR
jgi:23S rRNA (uracil1939-C5)-methyltransferase